MAGDKSKAPPHARVQRGGTLALPHFVAGACALASSALISHFVGESAIASILIVVTYLTAFVCAFAGLIGAMTDVVAMRAKPLSLVTLLLHIALSAAFVLYSRALFIQGFSGFPGG